MTDNKITQRITAYLEMEESFNKCMEDWIKDCNEKGLEIFYSMKNAKTRKVDGIKMKIGHWDTRPCKNHKKGHICNPCRGNVRITGFGS